MWLHGMEAPVATLCPVINGFPSQRSVTIQDICCFVLPPNKRFNCRFTSNWRHYDARCYSFDLCHVLVVLPLFFVPYSSKAISPALGKSYDPLCADEFEAVLKNPVGTQHITVTGECITKHGCIFYGVYGNENICTGAMAGAILSMLYQPALLLRQRGT